MNAKLLYIIIVIGISMCFVGNILMGNPALGLHQVLNYFFGEQENVYQFIIQHRLNRTIMAFIGGGGLAVAGLLLQVYFRNPLAGPGVLGVTSGATFGVSLVILGGVGFSSVWGKTMLISGGVFGALFIIILLLTISRFIKNSISLLVLGLMFSYFTSAIISTLNLWSNQAQTREFMLWGLGNFEGRTYQELIIVSIIVLGGFVLAWSLTKALNGLVLGEAYAKSMGINIRQIKWQIILITGVIAGIITAFCGPIGFIGIAVPQIVRLIVKTSNHRSLIPLIFLCGAFLGILADFTVRLTNNQLPLNAVTALVGAPVIIYVIVRMNKRYA